MIEEIKLRISSNEESLIRQKRIVKKLNLEKLPFKISSDGFCDMYINMLTDMSKAFHYQNDRPGMRWCLSTIKKFKIFILIFEANELGNEIYKENISNKLPEYSYKTIAQIIDHGIAKGYFVKLAPRKCKMKDSKIRNIRPSEALVVEFMNWNIELIYTISAFQKKYA